MKSFVVLLSLFTASVSMASTKNFIVSEELNCKGQADNQAFANHELKVNYRSEGAKGEALDIVGANGAINARMQSYESAFLPETDTLSGDLKAGYIMFTPSTEQQNKVHIAMKIGPGSYQNSVLDCELASKPVIGKLKVEKITCVTTKAIKKSVQTVKFTLVGSDDPSQLSIPGSFKMSPRNNIMSSLNENLSISTSDKTIRFFGDSAGIDFAIINLDKASNLTKGTLELRTEGETNKKFDLQCTVK